MFLIVMVVNDPYLCKDLFKSWKEAGVQGATIIDSLGLQRALKGAIRDSLPLMPTLADIETSDESRNRTIFSVVPDQDSVNRVKEATEACLGPLDQKESGFMFVVPIKEIFGLEWD